MCARLGTRNKIHERVRKHLNNSRFMRCIGKFQMSRCPTSYRTLPSLNYSMPYARVQTSRVAETPSRADHPVYPAPACGKTVIGHVVENSSSNAQVMMMLGRPRLGSPHACGEGRRVCRSCSCRICCSQFLLLGHSGTKSIRLYLGKGGQYGRPGSNGQSAR